MDDGNMWADGDCNSHFSLLGSAAAGKKKKNLQKTYWSKPSYVHDDTETFLSQLYCEIKKSFTSLTISPEKVIWNSKGIHTFIIDLMIIDLKGWKYTTCLRHTEHNWLTLNYSFKRNVTSHGKASNEWDQMNQLHDSIYIHSYE